MSSDPQHPQHAEALHLLGVSAIREKRYADAIELIQQAIAIDPRAAAYHNNLGTALRDAERLVESESALRRAIAIDPRHAKAHYNLAKTARDLDRIDEAMQLYQRAIELDPSYAKAHYSLGLLHLLRGDLKRGWEGYDWRWRRADFKSPRRNAVQPAWDGAPMPGKMILLWPEQGMGDMIQFARYVPMVAERAAKVVVECHPPLIELMKSIRGVDDARAPGEAVGFDVQLPMLSLPRIFATTLQTISQNVPYVHADATRIGQWSTRLQTSRGTMKVGIAWAGSPLHREDKSRSISPDLFAPLAELRDITFVSLQKSLPADAPRPPLPLLDYADELNDFADSAALMMNLDLILTVDTAPAHLAGALARPVWTMLPFDPDWRWMLDREDSPWYPSMRLFRQPKRGDWPSVIRRVVDELREETE